MRCSACCGTTWLRSCPASSTAPTIPTPARLAAAKRRYGLRTLINLRGHRQCGSDALSRRASAELGLHHVDMAFESRGAPHRDRILRFADIYRTLDAPALMHCKSGADRAGLAAGLALLFEGGASRDALAQLSWRFGHWNRSRTGILDAFFIHYAEAAGGPGAVPALGRARIRRGGAAAGLRRRGLVVVPGGPGAGPGIASNHVRLRALRHARAPAVPRPAAGGRARPGWAAR